MAKSKKEQPKAAEEVVMETTVSQEKSDGKAATEEIVVDVPAEEDAQKEEQETTASEDEAVPIKEKEYMITAPTAYSGVIGKVQFFRGVGRTKDQWKADWFRSHGYRVEEA